LTRISYHRNDQGKLVKTTSIVRRQKEKIRRNKRVIGRRQWKKFGDCAGKSAGPEKNVTYQAHDDLVLKLRLGGDAVEEEKKAPSGTGKVVCRFCGEEGHWTLKCPKRDSATPTIAGKEILVTPSRSSGSNVYRPPVPRGGSSYNDRDDSNTLRVSNLSEDTSEMDLRDLFGPFGRTSRVYLAKDRRTNKSRGFGFVSFNTRSDADRAREKLDGHGFDNLILRVEWAQPRE
jgi:translation initiation factor 3 subunit G